MKTYADLEFTKYQFATEIGSVYEVPVRVIVLSHANYYFIKGEYDSLPESISATIDLFNDNTSEIEDWARNSIDWSEVKDDTQLISSGKEDMQEAWMNSENINII